MGRYSERDAEEAMYGNPYYANVKNNSSMMIDTSVLDQNVRASMNSHKRVRSSTNYDFKMGY